MVNLTLAEVSGGWTLGAAIVAAAALLFAQHYNKKQERKKERYQRLREAYANYGAAVRQQLAHMGGMVKVLARIVNMQSAMEKKTSLSMESARFVLDMHNADHDRVYDRFNVLLADILACESRIRLHDSDYERCRHIENISTDLRKATYQAIETASRGGNVEWSKVQVGELENLSDWLWKVGRQLTEEENSKDFD